MLADFSAKPGAPALPPCGGRALRGWTVWLGVGHQQSACTNVSSDVQAQNRSMRETVLVLTTVPADFDTRSMASALVESRLAACVTVFPAVQSVYKWKGTTEVSDEQQLLIKTTRDRVDALWLELKARHPYDVPECVVVPIVGGNPAYLQWIVDSAGVNPAPE
jgi:periplasmic divalent cation tolerance protein